VGEAMVKMTPEQEEILDSGLRMLAHMIAETHLRRVALRKQNETTTQLQKANRRTTRKKPCKLTDDNLSGGHDE
jgi:hypothetical protein